jgi:hypothetical protein
MSGSLPPISLSLRLGTSDVIPLNPCGHSPHVTSSLMTGGPRLRSYSRVWVPLGSWPYFTASDSRHPQPGGPHPHIYIYKGYNGLEPWIYCCHKQFQSTIATNCWALTCCMNVSYTAGNERACSILFKCIVSILRVLLIFWCGHAKCN